MIFLYNLFWILSLPFVLLLMVFRIVTGKEDILRLPERLGIPSKFRPKTNIVWIHAASVGETKIALTIATNLRKSLPKTRFLITTGTVTSAKIVRDNMSKHILHQLIPIDNGLSIWMFFKYWKPQIGIVVESEIWPNLLHVGSGFCPLILANARMSDKSFRRWSKYKFALPSILNKFKVILSQSEIDHKKYVELGASNVVYAGNLKYSANKLDIDAHKLRFLKSQTKGRMVFLAASTHPGEEEIILDAHMKLAEKYPKLLTIIAPRHTGRSGEIATLVKNHNLSLSIRSKNQTISTDTDVYIADTLGELGLFFTIAKATFMGGSFNIGGHNLIEPAYFPTIIIFGPDMSNCQEVADEFLEKKAAFQIKDTNELVGVLDKIYSNKICANEEKNALIIQKHNNIINNYLSYIKQYLKK